MGRASRHKKSRPPVEGRLGLEPTTVARARDYRSGRPRWSGANGFDYAWALNEGYLAAGEALLNAADRATDNRGRLAQAEALSRLAQLQLDQLCRKVATMEAVLARTGGTRSEKREQRATEPMFPGKFTESQLDDEMEKGIERHRPYAMALSNLAHGHREALTHAIPILFDPLSTPAIDDTAVRGLRLPFPTVTCDFLSQSGMSMPVQLLEGSESGWVGLVAATFQQTGDVLDVWPVVTTLYAENHDEDQKQRTLLFGRARFGGELPEPPSGLTKLEIGAASVWVAAGDDKDAALWASAWVVSPGLAAASALRLLEAVNVSLGPVRVDRAERRRAQREGAEPALEVVIRTSHAALPIEGHGSVDWQHRWTVRGHWKHFRRGAIFDANPRKRVVLADGTECVRVWCPPFVKGPEDRPLVLKSRRADHGLVGGPS